MGPNDIILASWDCGSTKKFRRTLPINSGVLLIKKCPLSINLCKDILVEEPSCYLERCKCRGRKMRFS